MRREVTVSDSPPTPPLPLRPSLIPSPLFSLQSSSLPPSIILCPSLTLTYILSDTLVSLILSDSPSFLPVPIHSLVTLGSFFPFSPLFLVFLFKFICRRVCTHSFLPLLQPLHCLLILSSLSLSLSPHPLSLSLSLLLARSLARSITASNLSFVSPCFVLP